MNFKTTTILPIMALSTVLAACNKGSSEPVEKHARFASTLVVSTSEHNESNFYSGDVHARHETTLAFRIAGKLVERQVDAGAIVKAGQPLARIDAVDTGLQKNSAEAQLQLIEDDLKRNRELRDKGFISQSALDSKEAAFKVAKAQDELAKNQNNYTNLISDHAGVIISTSAEVGQVVSAGQAIMQLAQDGEREVLVAIPESRFSALKVGMRADIELGTDGSASLGKYIGRLRELSPAADAASRTYAARVTITNADNQIALGMTARVRFGAANSLGGQFVPLTAIFQQGNDPAVWIVAQDGSVSLRAVKVAAYLDEGAMITEGINVGERIVSAGVHKLTAGEKIQFVENGNAK